MKLGGVVESVLYCDDLVAMRGFYETVLGLDCISFVDNQHVFFNINRSMLLVFNRAYTSGQSATVNGALVPSHGSTGPGHLALEAEPGEYSACRKALTDQKIPIESDVSWPSGIKSFYFRDPAGNSIEITEFGLWE